LLLSSKEIIYACGNNEYGQLGICDTNRQWSPIQLNFGIKFKEIASHFDTDISVSRSYENEFYVWGDLGDIHFFKPTLINSESFGDIFLHHTVKRYNQSVKIVEFTEPFSRNEYYNKKYVSNRYLGEGSYGIVYEAKKNENVYEAKKNENVMRAIKIIKPEDKIEKEFLKEFINYCVISSLKTDYFVKHFDAWFENNINAIDARLSLYIEMELCDKNLKDLMMEIRSEFYIENFEALSPIGYYIASQLFIEILESVQYLHEKNIIHRDLSPYNILLKKEDNNERFVKIGDFGIIAIYDKEKKSYTKDIGNTIYMAPEVGSCNEYGTISDIYTLGILLMELFYIDVHK
jgi:serine/threonine protein kinase